MIEKDRWNKLKFCKQLIGFLDKTNKKPRKKKIFTFAVTFILGLGIFDSFALNAFASNPAVDYDAILTGTPYKFSYTGDGQEFVAPKDGVYCFELWGASGISDYRGYARSNITLKKGDTYYIYCGSSKATSSVNINGFNHTKTFNGGGNAYDSSHSYGGGATDLRTVKADDNNWYIATHKDWLSDRSINSRFIVAGGGSGYCGEAGTNLTTLAETSESASTGDCMGVDGSKIKIENTTKTGYPEPIINYAEVGGGGGGYLGAVYNIYKNWSDDDLNCLAIRLTGMNYIDISLRLNKKWGDDYCYCGYGRGTGLKSVPYTSIHDASYQEKLKADEWCYYSYAVKNYGLADDGEGFAYVTYLGKDITVNANGGKFSTNESEITKRISSDSGKTVSDLDIPTRKGYIFKGWSTAQTGGEEVNNETTISDLTSTTLYAQWSLNTYSITYNLDGGTNASTNPSNYTIENANFNLLVPVKDGYTFLGWTWDENTTPQKNVTIDTSQLKNLNFYAQWSLNTYSIKYNLDGGTNASINLSSYTIEDTDFNLQAPTKDGYLFLGWTGSNGTTMQTEVTVGTAQLSNLSYTANWRKVGINDYEIEDNTDYTSVLNKIPLKYNYTGNVQMFKAPVDGTYSLECWGATGGKVNYTTSSSELEIYTSGDIYNSYIPNIDSYVGGKYAYTNISLKKDDIIYVYVGDYQQFDDGGSFNGGGIGYNSQNIGGGATDMRLLKASKDGWYDLNHTSWNEDASLLSRIVTAGGGGGFTNGPSNLHVKSDNPVSNNTMGIGTIGTTGRINSNYYTGGGGGGYYGGDVSSAIYSGGSLQVAHGGTSLVKKLLDNYTTFNTYMYDTFDPALQKRIPKTSVNLLDKEVQDYYLNNRTKDGNSNKDVATYFKNSAYFETTNNNSGYAYITLIATEEETKEHNITFNANGGKYANEAETYVATLKKGDAYGTIESPTRALYTFLGWYTDATEGTKIDIASTMDFAEDEITLYAHWKQIDLGVAVTKYNLTANGNNYNEAGMNGIVSNDESSVLTIHATAKFKDGSSTENLVYALYKDVDGTQTLVTGNVLKETDNDYAVFNIIGSAKGNGTYRIIATDKVDAKITSSSSDFTVSTFDTTAPVIVSTNISDKDTVTNKKTITINATDGVIGDINVASLNTSGSYFVEKSSTKRTSFGDITWKGGSDASYTMDITEKGTYYVYVRDVAGNVVSDLVEADNVDNTAPTITFDASFHIADAKSAKVIFYGLSIASGDGINQDLHYKAYDKDGNTLAFKVKEADADGYFTNLSLLKDSNGNPMTDSNVVFHNGTVWFAFAVSKDTDFTVEVTDDAGNVATKNISIDYSEYVKMIDGMTLIDGSGYITITPSTTAWTNSTVSLTPTVSGIDYDSLSKCFFWTSSKKLTTFEGAGTWYNESNNHHTAQQNGSYTVYVKNKDNTAVYYKNYDVTNIDTTAPVIGSKTLSTDGKTLTVTVSDSGCGLNYIQFAGGTQNTVIEKNLTVNSDNVTTDGKTATANLSVAESGTYTINVYDLCNNKTTVSQNITIANSANSGKHIVTFATYNGGIVKAEYIVDGGSATPPTSLTREGYIFTGWDAPYVGITKDTVCTAVWQKNSEDKDVTVYTVSFKNWDGSIVESESVAKGGSATPPTTHLTRDGYDFSGWDKSYVNIKEDTTCTAVWVKVNKDAGKTYHIVAFANYDDSVIKSETVEDGGSATPPTTVVREGYTFTGWSGSYSNVHDNVVCKAQFIEGDKTATTGTSTNKTASVNTGTKTTTTDNAKSVSENALEDESTEVALTEFSDEAITLSASSYDNNTVSSNEVDEEFNKDIVNNLMDEETGTGDESAEQEYNSKGIGVPQVMAILVLVGSAGFGVFYLLNKKYYWVNLPF